MQNRVVSLLKSDVPRQVSLDFVDSVVVIVDTCYERDSRDRICGLGAILFDNSCNLRLDFSCELEEEQRCLLGERNQKETNNF